jgi:hypothetical protein
MTAKAPFHGHCADINNLDDLKWFLADGVLDKFPQFLRNWNPWGRLIEVRILEVELERNSSYIFADSRIRRDKRSHSLGAICNIIDKE